MKKLVFLIITAYLLFAAFAYFFTDSVMFEPRTQTYKDNAEIIKLKTPDGALLSAIYLKNPKATYTILASHGNAEDLHTSYPRLKLFQQHGFNVFAYDYRGYGTSTGIPSEENVYTDIDTAYNYLIHNLKISPDKIIVYGFSLGTAVSIDLASHKKIGGLIVQSAFLSAPRVYTQIPISPFDKFNNLKKITSITYPVLFIHGTNDTFVPFWHGKKLYETTLAPKKYLWVNGAGHNDILQVAGKDYWQAIDGFVNDFLSRL
jgi:hypothetical protein